MSVEVGQPIEQPDLQLLAAAAAPLGSFDFALGATNYLAVMQAIRTALFAEIFSDPLAHEFRVSEPQCVGINPNHSYGENGRLYLGDAYTPVPATNYLPKFRDVRFLYSAAEFPLLAGSEQWYAGDDSIPIGASAIGIFHKLRFARILAAVGVTWTSAVQTATDGSFATRTIYDKPYNFSFSQAMVLPVAETASVLTRYIIPIAWQGGGTAPTPTVGDFIFVTDQGTVEFTVGNDQKDPLSPHGNTVVSGLTIIAIVTADITASTTFNFDLVSNGFWSFGAYVSALPATGGHTWPSTAATARANASAVDIDELTILTVDQTLTDPDPVTVIHPNGHEGFSTTIAELDVVGFTVATARGIDYLELNWRACPGMWLASTLPTPAVNCYLDQNFPPYVDDTGEFWFVNFTGQCAIKGGSRYIHGSTGNNPEPGMTPRSSLRMAAPVLNQSSKYFATLYTDSTAITIPIGGNFKSSMPFPYWHYKPFDIYGLNAGQSPINQKVITVIADDGPFTVYVSRNASVSPTDYDITIAGDVGTPVDISLELLTSALSFGTDAETIYYLIVNDHTAANDIFRVLEVFQDFSDFPVPRPVEPGIQTQPSLWPVMRDTDTYPWYGYRNLFLTNDPAKRDEDAIFGIDRYRIAWEVDLVVAWLGGTPIPNNGTGQDVLFASLETRRMRVSVTPAMPIYVRRGQGIDPDHLADPGAFDDFSNTGTIILEGGVWAQDIFAMVLNNTGSPQSPRLKWSVEYFPTGFLPTDPARTTLVQFPYSPTPVFFPTVREGFSYNILPPSDINTSVSTPDDTVKYPKPIPQRGYVIYNVLVRRQPIEVLDEHDEPLNPRKFADPTELVDMTELAVTIGTFAGLTHDFEQITKGAFTALKLPDGTTDCVITIPEGEMEARVEVFWPVVGGCLLAYQCSEMVRVEPLVNWQPIFHNKQYAAAWYEPFQYGRRYEDASAWHPDELCRYRNYFPIKSYFDGPVGGGAGYGYAYWGQFKDELGFPLDPVTPYDPAHQVKIVRDSEGNPINYVQFPMAVPIYNDMMLALSRL